jgi:hypothetical protein
MWIFKKIPPIEAEIEPRRYIVLQLTLLTVHEYHSTTKNSMEQNPPWVGIRSSASQISHILWKPKAHCRIHKRLPRVPTLRSIQFMSHPTSWKSILILSSHLRLGLSWGLLLSALGRRVTLRSERGHDAVQYEVAGHMTGLLVMWRMWIFRKISPMHSEIQPRTYIAFQVKFLQFLADRNQNNIVCSEFECYVNVNILSNGSRDTPEKFHYSPSKVHLCIEWSQWNSSFLVHRILVHDMNFMETPAIDAEIQSRKMNSSPSKVLLMNDRSQPNLCRVCRICIKYQIWFFF